MTAKEMIDFRDKFCYMCGTQRCPGDEEAISSCDYYKKQQNKPEGRRNNMKIYQISFNEYTNITRDTVSNRSGVKNEYIYVGQQPFLITENQIEKIREYGGGIAELKFVGNLWEE